MNVAEVDTLRGTIGLGIDLPRELKERAISETIADAIIDRFDEFVKIKKIDNGGWSFEIEIVKQKLSKEG